MVGRGLGRALASVARGGCARLCALFLHARRRSHRLALRHVLLSGSSIHPVAGRDRRFVVPLGLRIAYPRPRGCDCRRVPAVSPRRVGLLRRRQIASPHIADCAWRNTGLADVRVRDRSEHAFVAAPHLQHEGCGRLLRLAAGLPQVHRSPIGASMTRAASLLLLGGMALFLAVLVSQGVPAIVSALSLAGWGLLLVALFHVVPLVLDAAAIRVLFERDGPRGSMRHALLARWVGESANSLMPAGPICGPLVDARHS